MNHIKHTTMAPGAILALCSIFWFTGCKTQAAASHEHSKHHEMNPVIQPVPMNDSPTNLPQ